MIPDWLKPALKPAAKGWLRCQAYKTDPGALIVPVHKGHLSWVVDCEDTRPGHDDLMGLVDLKVEILRVKALPYAGLVGNVINVADDIDWVALVAYGQSVAWVGVGNLSENAYRRTQ